MAQQRLEITAEDLNNNPLLQSLLRATLNGASIWIVIDGEVVLIEHKVGITLQLLDRIINPEE